MFHLSDFYFLWGRKDTHRHNISGASIIKEARTVYSEKEKKHPPSFHSPVDNKDPKHAGPVPQYLQYLLACCITQSAGENFLFDPR